MEIGSRSNVGDGIRAVLLNWTPTDESVVAHGPFVIRIPKETIQAIQDFQTGQMGQLT